jgi:hypothetical protein
MECLTVGGDGDTRAVKAGGSSKSWLWPVIIAVLLLLVCVCLVFAVVHLYKKVKRNTITYGTDILEEAEFMEMSYEPRITDLGSADNVQLLPPDDS